MKFENSTYTQLYKQYVNDLYSYGINLGFSEGMCMDAIHDIFCKIFINKNELSNIQNIKYYLFKSLKNRLIDINKQNLKLSKNNIDDYTFSVEVSVVDIMIDDEERLFLENRVKNLMEKLTNNQREAIYLRYMEELEYEEIAQLLNISPESARKLVYRGIDKLREHSTLNILLILSLYFRYL